MPVTFSYADRTLNLPAKTKLKAFIASLFTLEGKSVHSLNYVFCSDEFLLDINKRFLQHDYYTDIITFDNSEEDGKLEGDIYVSIDRVKENADHIGVSFDIELRRVLVHGLLHLIGFGDSDEDLKQQMRTKEDECLLLY